VFSAKGAALTTSLGQGPRIKGSKALALKARFVSRAIETRLQRSVTR